MSVESPDESSDDTTLSGSHLRRFLNNIWPRAVIIVGLTLSLAWTLSLGYALFQLAAE